MIRSLNRGGLEMQVKERFCFEEGLSTGVLIVGSLHEIKGLVGTDSSQYRLVCLSGQHRPLAGQQVSIRWEDDPSDFLNMAIF